jgi:hypothetical protein
MQLSLCSPLPELGRTSGLRHLLLVMVRPWGGTAICYWCCLPASQGIGFLVRWQRRGRRVWLPSAVVLCSPIILLPAPSSGVSRHRTEGPPPLDRQVPVVDRPEHLLFWTLCANLKNQINWPQIVLVPSFATGVYYMSAVIFFVWNTIRSSVQFQLPLHYRQHLCAILPPHPNLLRLGFLHFYRNLESIYQNWRSVRVSSY